MKKFLFAASIAVVGALLPAAANAATLIPVYDTFGGFTFKSTVVAKPTFTDTVTFTALKTGTFDGSISSNNFIKFSLMQIGTTNGTTFNFGPASFGSLSDFAVKAGNSYTLTIKGSNSNKIANYTGNFTLSAVPEPASWAMMLTGFGLVGVAARQRRSTNLKTVAA